MFVLEEETDPRRFSIHRLAHYCLDLGELYGTDRVVPVVIFLRGRAPRRELVLGTERHAYLHFDFIACELATIAYEGFRDSDNIVARLNLPNMRSWIIRHCLEGLTCRARARLAPSLCCGIGSRA